MSEEDLSGKIIEGYHVTKPIGQGKFATVYKAESKDNKIVALKKIKIFEMNDAKLREKCLKEVKLMQQLDHPNIIKYLDSFISNNELIIVTEWAEKGDLKKLLKIAQQSDNPLPEPVVWEYVYQVAGALKHMHDKRIMHRDLKPANIFISQDDTLKVGDFGLGRVFSEETIEAYSKVGTPLYMSPELLIGEGYDMKSDVWSLGCIAYEMCEMKSPFRNENEKMSLMDLFNNITKGEYKPISDKYSKDLRNTIQNMIVVEPSKRYDLNQVLGAYQEYKEVQKSGPKIDSYLLMEDIFEKLNLVNYQMYCHEQMKSPIHRLFFAAPEPNVKLQDKFMRFIEISYWILSLIETKVKSKNKQSFSYNAYAVHDEIAAKLLEDVKSIGMTVPSHVTIPSLKLGYGDAVCHILNELLTRELIAQNYQFKTPNFDNSQNDEYIEIEGDDLDSQLIFKENDGEINGKLLLNDIDTKEPQDKLNEENANLNQQQQSRNSSNSTSATSTVSEQYEIDPIEWAKEIDRVSKELAELAQNVEKMEIGQFHSSYETDSNFHIHMKNMSIYTSNLNHCLKMIQESKLQQKIQELQYALDKLNRGENIINRACQHLNENLKQLIEQKKEIYKQLSARTEIMKERISQFDKLNKDYHFIMKQLKEKEESLLDENKISKIKQAISQLKMEIKEMDCKNEITKSFILYNLKKQKQQEDLELELYYQDDEIVQNL